MTVAMGPRQEFPRVSVVFVTYNRSQTLVATYETFLASVAYPRERLELILADDASDGWHRRIIDRLDFDVRVRAPRNQGQGANANRGVRAASGDYVLFLQDDWMLMRDGAFLARATAFLEQFADVGIVLLRDWDPPSHAGLPEPNADGIGLFDSEAVKAAGARRYSDNPHLKRRDFHDVVGWYQEGVDMAVMEDRMTAAVAAQIRYASALLKGTSPFVHIGDRWSFNPTRRRVALQNWLKRLPGGTALLGAYRRLKRRAS